MFRNCHLFLSQRNRWDLSSRANFRRPCICRGPSKTHLGIFSFLYSGVKIFLDVSSWKRSLYLERIWKQTNIPTVNTYHYSQETSNISQWGPSKVGRYWKPVKKKFVNLFQVLRAEQPGGKEWTQLRRVKYGRNYHHHERPARELRRNIHHYKRPARELGRNIHHGHHKNTWKCWTS